MSNKYNLIGLVVLLFSLIACKEDDEASVVDPNIVDLPCMVTEVIYNDEYGEDKYTFETEGNNLTKVVNVYEEYEFDLSFTYSGNTLTGLSAKAYEDGVLVEDEDADISVESANGLINKIEVRQSFFDEDLEIYENSIFQVNYEYSDNILVKIEEYEGYDESPTADFSNIEFEFGIEYTYTYDAQGNLSKVEQFEIDLGTNSRRLKPNLVRKNLLNLLTPKKKENSKASRNFNTADESDITVFEYDDNPNPFTALNYSSRVILSSTGILFFFGEGQLLSNNNSIIFNNEYTSTGENPFTSNDETVFDLDYNEFDLPIKSNTKILRTYTSGDFTDTNNYEFDITIDYLCD